MEENEEKYEGGDYVVTLKFDLDYDIMSREGITEDDMLDPMREHARKHGIEEIRKGVFAKDGENALCVIMMYVTDITRKRTDYVKYIKSWLLDTGNEVEDCKQEVLRLYKKKGIVCNE